MAKGTSFFKTPWSERGTIERVAIIAAGTIGAIGSVVVVKRIASSVRARKVAKTFGTDLEAFESIGMTPTYMDSQYLMFADTLETAMDSTWYDWGTDELTVFGVMLKMKNDLDVNKLILAFGTRDAANLMQWISGDFGQTEKDFYVNSALKKNNIQYRF